MTDRVVVDEWTVILLGDRALSSAAAARLRDVVSEELATTTERLSVLLSPAAVELLPP